MCDIKHTQNSHLPLQLLFIFLVSFINTSFTVRANIFPFSPWPKYHFSFSKTWAMVVFHCRPEDTLHSYPESRPSTIPVINCLLPSHQINGNSSDSSVPWEKVRNSKSGIFHRIKHLDFPPWEFPLTSLQVEKRCWLAWQGTGCRRPAQFTQSQS